MRVLLVAPVARAGDDERERAFRIGESEMERRVAAHGEAAHVGLPDPEVVEHALDVVGRLLLRVRLRVERHVGRRVAARVEDDRPVPPREEPDL